MKNEEYENILKELQNIPDLKSKRDYLDTHIEQTDNERNGLNDELIRLRNKINKDINQS